MLVICAVLVSYVSSQKGEFIIVGRILLLYVGLMSRKYFAGNLMACIITNNEKGKSKKNSFEVSKVTCRQTFKCCKFSFMHY